MRHHPMYMSDYVEHLDNVLKTTGEKLLQGAGTISHAQVMEKATEEYRKYQVQNLSSVEEQYLESINSLHSSSYTVPFLIALKIKCAILFGEGSM